jgi:5-methylcytosine-specific restriction protein B
MAKYFSISQIKQAIEHLSQYDSKAVIPAFVFACNLVDSSAEYRELGKGVGTDNFLKFFFSGELIGLPKKGDGDSLRPKFADLGGLTNTTDDYLIHQKVKLWGSAYSRNGYREMVAANLLEKEAGSTSSYRLTEKFQPAFEASLPNTFKFEYFLVWLFAFKEIPDQVDSWMKLFGFFRDKFINGAALPSEYSSRFSLSDPPVPWPTDFLIGRPSDLEYQRALLPTHFVEPITHEIWLQVQAKLEELMLDYYEGIKEEEINAISRSIISGLAGTKRIFLLGDPGTGKTKLAEFLRLAFESVVDSSRLLTISTDITDKSSESTLVGFVGLDGNWVVGTLTASRGSMRLLHEKGIESNSNIRSQVNLIILDEANRRDIESMLARVQTALDCSSRDPEHEAYTIALGKSGDHLISPFTYLVMTGNSPRDDDGRSEQSRPFRRRPSLISVPNPLRSRLADCSKEDFVGIVKRIWLRNASDSQAQGPIVAEIAEKIINAETELELFREVLLIMGAYQLGISYGLLRKIVILAGNEYVFGESTYRRALDAALTAGLTATLSSSNVVNDKSLRSSLLDLGPPLATTFPRFSDVVQNVLSEISEFGTVAPHF